jgi:hypothetical protein
MRPAAWVSVLMPVFLGRLVVAGPARLRRARAGILRVSVVARSIRDARRRPCVGGLRSSGSGRDGSGVPKRPTGVPSRLGIGSSADLHRTAAASLGAPGPPRPRSALPGRRGPAGDPSDHGSLGGRQRGGSGGTASGGPPSVNRACQRRLAVAARDRASVGSPETARRQPLESPSGERSERSE